MIILISDRMFQWVQTSATTYEEHKRLQRGLLIKTNSKYGVKREVSLSSPIIFLIDVTVRSDNALIFR